MMEDNSRARIVAETMKLFNYRGYKSVTMREIANHLGISSRTLYNLFPSKEDIAEEVISLLSQNVNEGILQVRNSKSDPVSKLRQVIYLVKNELIAINPLLIRDISLYVPNLNQRILNRRDEFVQLIEDYIKQGQAAGLIKKEINPELAAHTYIGMLRALINTQNDDMHGYSKEEVFDFLICIFFTGICENHTSK
ncbi:TetR/AcrR family transcriptional regulator [Pelotomaculum propionicicum]|uniref:HTH-type transcriptional repressor NicS n=1 Tax=Pelotomaculum propionicicum TaxID=258475 RepID=A0A4Y7RQ25_9FIRM|nr:TetR/AcrR family transcriptional regulator [Pelotomaculum propionicicum]NLI12424.1 TetR/AcrR family transcriptional regulator [Peptococcaceae bacterium]TEB10961.1 HTH-type transcriptional repressor NicS [Pelotomaculum propionicicum]